MSKTGYNIGICTIKQNITVPNQCQVLGRKKIYNHKKRKYINMIMYCRTDTIKIIQ